MKVSYIVTVCQEVDEVNRLLQKLLEFKTADSEIVVFVDTGHDADNKHLAEARDRILKSYTKYCSKIIFDKFEGHFGDWKNKANNYCTGEFIVQLDADEIPSDLFLKHIAAILEANPEVDLYLIPRVNTVEGITSEDIQKWNWQINEKGWINYPDYQGRVYRNSPEIKWTGKVHEKVTGFNKYGILPDALAMFHPKTISKQRAQNKLYNTMQ